MSNRRNRLAYAVVTVLTGTGFSAAAPGVALAQEAAADSIEEVLVTAQRRTQSLQDVPIASISEPRLWGVEATISF